MTFFKRFLVLFICGAVQVFFATYLLLELLGFDLAWLIFGVLLVWFALGDLRQSRNG